MDSTGFAYVGKDLTNYFVGVVDEISIWQVFLFSTDVQPYM